LKIITFNAHRLEAGFTPICGMLKQQDADVICLQEAHFVDQAHGAEDPVAQFADRLGEFSKLSRYTLRLPEDQACDTAVLSRWPIKQGKAHTLSEHGWVYAVEATLDIKGREVRVFSVHTHATWRLLDPIHVKESTATRHQQVEAILALIRDSCDEIIVAGDFNTTPDSIEYSRLTTELSDFATGRQSNDATIPAMLPLLRFDYIFGKGPFEVKSYSVVDSNLSDHRPVVANVELRPR
jgi:endonuclease/exonuclease/phosphatase family metal-dependent hydrolase